MTEKADTVLRLPRTAAEGKEGTGLWGWLLQRVTAVLVFVALGAHTWVLHYQNVGEPINFQGVADRFNNPWLVTMDIALLTTGVYHGLNGLRAVIFDFGISRSAQRIVTWILVLIGAVALLFGINTLMAFLRGSAFLW